MQKRGQLLWKSMIETVVAVIIGGLLVRAAIGIFGGDAAYKLMSASESGLQVNTFYTHDENMFVTPYDIAGKSFFSKFTNDRVIFFTDDEYDPTRGVYWYIKNKDSRINHTSEKMDLSFFKVGTQIGITTDPKNAKAVPWKIDCPEKTEGFKNPLVSRLKEYRIIGPKEEADIIVVWYEGSYPDNRSTIKAFIHKDSEKLEESRRWACLIIDNLLEELKYVGVNEGFKELDGASIVPTDNDLIRKDKVFVLLELGNEQIEDKYNMLRDDKTMKRIIQTIIGAIE